MGVLGTRWHIAAIAAQNGGKESLVQANNGTSPPLRLIRLWSLHVVSSFGMAWRTQSTNRSNGTSTTSPAASTTTSIPAGGSALATASRRRRLALLRTTAFPTDLLATMPTAAGPGSPATAITVMPPTVVRSPTRNALLKRVRPRSAVNGRRLDGEAAPALAASTFDHRPASTGAHTRSKAVDLMATTHVWLIGAFHEDQSEVGSIEYRLRRGTCKVKARSRNIPISCGVPAAPTPSNTWQTPGRYHQWMLGFSGRRLG